MELRLDVEKPAMARGIFLQLLCLAGILLSSCGGNPGPAGVGTVPLPPPKPLDVSVTLDETRAVSQVVPLRGGTLSVTSEDGAVYTLTVPEGALLEETTITMTPIQSLEGSPVTGGKPYGVDLKPDSLRLYQAATLRISPADESGTEQAVGFATKAGGKEFHLYPLALEPSLSMKLLHFSDYGTFVGSETDPIIITDEPAEFMPFDWESQLAQMMAELIRQEREAQLRGEKGDPEFEKKVEAILNTFYTKVISPLLGRISSNCDFAKANVAKVLSWNRQVGLLGLDATFDTQMASVTNAVVRGMDNCWQEVIQPCVDPEDESFGEVVRVARMNQLLGGDPKIYNPNDPDIQCDEGCSWLKDVQAIKGTVMMAYSGSGQDEQTSVQVERQADVTVTFGRTPYSHWEGTAITGSASIHDTYKSRSGSTDDEIVGSGSPLQEPSSLTINADNCMIERARVVVSVEAHNTTIDGAATSTVGVVYLEDVPLSGSAQLPASPWSSGVGSFVALGQGQQYTEGFANFLGMIVGDDNLGTADVTWDFTPTQ